MITVTSLLKDSLLKWCDLLPTWKDSCALFHHSLEWSIYSVYVFEVELEEQLCLRQWRKMKLAQKMILS